MRRALAVIAALALCLPVMGGSVVVRRAVAGGGSPDLLNNEAFNAAGYDLAGWSETIGVSSIVDEDETALCPAATGFSSQCLETSSTGINSMYFAAYALAAPQGGPVYCRAYMNIVTSDGLGSGEDIVIAANSHSATAPNDPVESQFRLKLDNTGGTFSLIGRCRSSDFGTTTVLIGTTYLVEWYSDRSLPTDACDMKIGGVQKGPQNASASFSNDVTHIILGNSQTAWNQNADIVWDSVACSTAGWLGGL